MAVGVAGASGNVRYDVVKDVWYVGNAALTLYLGYLLALRMGSVRAILELSLAPRRSYLRARRPVCVQSVLFFGNGHRSSCADGGGLSHFGDRHRRRSWRRPFPCRYRAKPVVSVVISALCLASVTVSFSRTLWVVLLTGIVLAALTTRVVMVLRFMVIAVFVAGIAVLAGSTVDDADTTKQDTFIDKLMQTSQELKVVAI